MKRVIIHVGLHKTASSSIQNMLYSKRKELETVGVIYPTFEVDNMVFSNHSIPLYNVFYTGGKTYYNNIRLSIVDKIGKLNNLWKNQLNEILRLDGTKIFSGEDLSKLSEADFRAMLAYFSNYDNKVEVIGFVRRPYSFLCSMNQQGVKSGTNKLDAIVSFQNRHIVDMLINTVEVLKLISFESACSNATPMKVFCDNVGLDYEIFSSLEAVANKGYGNITTRLYAFINREIPLFKEGQLNKDRQHVKIIDVDEDKFLLTKQELTGRVVGDLDEDNETYKKLLGDSFCDNSYPAYDDFNLSIDDVDLLLMLFKSDSLLLPFVLKFIFHNCEVSKLIGLKRESIILLRDLALTLRDKDKSLAEKTIIVARLNRPDGELINQIYNNIIND